MGMIGAILASRWTRLAVLLAVGAIVILFILSMLPQPIAGVVRLDECTLMAAPVITAEDPWWLGALPGDAQRGGGSQIPIASWPDGLTYDMAAGTVVDAAGTIHFRRGDEVRIRGEIFEARGDPSPCYYIYSVRIQQIEAATP